MGKATQERRLFRSLDCRDFRCSPGWEVERRTSIRLRQIPTRACELKLIFRILWLLNEHWLCYWWLNITTSDFLSWSLLAHLLSSSRLQLGVVSVRHIPCRPQGAFAVPSRGPTFPRIWAKLQDKQETQHLIIYSPTTHQRCLYSYD